MSVQRKVGSILDAIGNTPLVKLRKLVGPESADVLLKLEYFNPTGSYKDRMAVAMIEGAERSGKLKPGMRVTEYTGGSTGSSLAMVCAIKGYQFLPVSSDAFAKEKLQTMQAFGARLQIVHSPSGKTDPALFREMISQAARLAQEPDVFWTDQFNNPDVIEGYKPLGQELVEQAGVNIDVFCAGVGTAGMLVGVSRALKAAGCAARIVALEPTSAPLLTTGQGGPHHVEGIGVGFMPPHLQRADYDEARSIDESEAREMARRLAKEEGVLAGTSTGLNVVAALKLAAELRPGHTAATVAVDTGLKYLAGNLFST